MSAPPQGAVRAYSELDGATFRRFGTGLINATFLAERAGETYVLQGLHPAFSGTVNDDIASLTAHLSEKGMTTPTLVTTRDGARWIADEGGRPWRVLTFVEGEAVDRVESPRRAYDAGRLVGRFHAALADFRHEYAFKREGVHDAARHRARLVGALDEHRSHRLLGDVARFSERAFEVLDRASVGDALTTRHAHGDLKISNLLFAEDGTGRALIDLDTIATMPLVYELGDAFRSWTNPLGEDVTEAAVDMNVFEAAISGYAASGVSVSQEERETLAFGLPRIAAELAVRFLTDALEEAYFGWNAEKYATRGDHNLVRARGQLSLAEDGLRKLGDAERAVRAALG